MATLTLKNARLIDGTGAPAIEAATVVIVDGKISEVRTSGDATTVANADLENLEPHERDMVSKRYGLNGEKQRSQKELALEMGIEQSQLRAMETRILLKLGVAGTGPVRGESAANQDISTIDLGGSTLLPGLINAHFHIMFDAGPDPFASLSRMSVAPAIVK